MIEQTLILFVQARIGQDLADCSENARSSFRMTFIAMACARKVESMKNAFSLASLKRLSANGRSDRPAADTRA
jgi:hypothetical protein